MKKLQDYTCQECQEFGKKIVDTEIYCCVTAEVEYIINASISNTGDIDTPFTYDDIENRFEEREEETDEDEEQEEVEAEIFEWWAVSSWLADRLAERGEPVIKSCGKGFWGRTCSGQAIKLDHVIQQLGLEYRS